MHKLPRDHIDATRERLRHAGDDHAIGDNGVRYLTDAPITRLANRGDLSKDRDTNRKLLEVAERYYRDWYLSGMDPLAAMDLSRPGSAGGSCGQGMPASEAQAARRQSWRDASEALGQKLRVVVDAVVLQENHDLVAIGQKVTAYKKRETARAVALDRLVSGLEVLMGHYRMTH
jgi:hypothetical protein